VPDAVMVEYAGGFGLLSVGPVFNLTSKSEVAISVGYVPPVYGDLWSVNIFLSRSFIKFRLCDKISLNLLDAGLFVNSNYGDNIYLKWPDKYDSGYYWWNSSIRFGPFVKSEVIFSSKSSRKISAFLECNTNDLYILSYVHSSQVMKIHHLLVMGAGVKIAIAKI